MNHQTFDEWASELETRIKIDNSSIEYFRWELERVYDQRFDEALTYYLDRPDLISQEVSSYGIELERLEQRFLEIEEYEKCAAIRDVRAELDKRYAQLG